MLQGYYMQHYLQTNIHNKKEIRELKHRKSFLATPHSISFLRGKEDFEQTDMAQPEYGSSQEADSWPWEKNQGGNVEKRTVFQWLNTPIFLKCCFWKMKVHSGFLSKMC